ncbi:transglutaminase family protein [Azoarcus sp. PA01]|nr:transglutaminase family protein [Azoarcus sp. PA01]
MIDAYLSPTPLIDSDHPEVLAFARAHCRSSDVRERAVSLYYAVRDGFRYDPYRIDLSETGMKASSVIASGAGWCVPKATLLTAVCRAAGIPARPGYADVRNHLSTERMRETFGADLYRWHGYTEILIDGSWYKATPAFNLALCERFGLLPLEFDGRSDSIYHPFDRSGNQHMEYIHQRGHFPDVPLSLMAEDFRTHYPVWLEQAEQLRTEDFLADVERENQPA